MFGFIVRPSARIAIVAAIIIAIAGIAAEAQEGGRSFSKDKILMIVSIPGLSFNELQEHPLKELPNIENLAQNNALAAMNIRTPGKGLEDSYATIGAGKPAVSDLQIQAHMAKADASGQNARQEYERYQGGLPQNAEIVIPEIEALRNMNAAQAYGAEPGLLGETLRLGGVHTYVFGNADEADMANPAQTGMDMSVKHRRYAPLMLMDRGGLVEFGDIGSRAVMNDPSRPAHLRTDYTYLLKRQQMVTAPAVVLFELGDLSRLYAEKSSYSTSVFQAVKYEILQEMDFFLGQLAAIAQERGKGTELWIFSPQVNDDAQRQKSLFGPLLQFDGQGESGLLGSATTRQSGIVANFDLTSSILAFFGIPPVVSMQGRTIKQAEAARQNGAGHLPALLEKVSTAQKIYVLRPKILYPLVMFEIIALLAGLLAVTMKWSTIAAWMRFMLFIVLLSPLWLVLTGYVINAPVAGILALFFVGMSLCGLVLNRLRLWAAFFTVGALTVVCLLLDGLFGAVGMKHSVLGYDPMIGARYYGIGNELMGVLIGAALLGISSGLQIFTGKNYGVNPRVKLTVILILFGIIIYLAVPTMGTNAGGAFTAFAAFGLFILRAFWGQPEENFSGRRFFLALAIFAAAALGVLYVFNGLLFRGGEQQSHIGRAMAALAGGDLKAIWLMIIRKLSMNWQLIGVSSWSKVLITSLFVMAMLVMKPRGVFRTWQSTYPAIMYGFSAASVGAIVALAVNDSGIVAAATMIVYTAAPMLMIRLSELSSGQVK